MARKCDSPVDGQEGSGQHAGPELYALFGTRTAEYEVELRADLREGDYPAEVRLDTDDVEVRFPLTLAQAEEWAAKLNRALAGGDHAE